MFCSKNARKIVFAYAGFFSHFRLGKAIVCQVVFYIVCDLYHLEVELIGDGRVVIGKFSAKFLLVFVEYEHKLENKHGTQHLFITFVRQIGIAHFAGKFTKFKCKFSVCIYADYV